MDHKQYTAAKAAIASFDARLAEIDAALADVRKLHTARESILEESKPIREAVNVHEQALRQAEKEARDAAREAAKNPTPVEMTPEQAKADIEERLALAKHSVTLIEAELATIKK